MNTSSSYFGMKVSCDPGQLNYLELFTSSHLESFLQFSDSVTALICFSLFLSHFLSRLKCNQQPESRPFPLCVPNQHVVLKWIYTQLGKKMTGAKNMGMSYYLNSHVHIPVRVRVIRFVCA